jgi:hypothetical protein
MKKLIGLALFGILALSATAFETRAASPSDKKDSTRHEMRKFDKFLRKHRTVEGDLRANPQMINDAQFLSQHKDLESFLRKNPKITADLSNDPNYFVERETRYQKHKHHWY